MKEGYTSDVRRLRTYIKGLDELMEDGIPKQHVVLICGHAGTMKSSLSYSILYNAALDGLSGMYLTLEQSCASLMRHMTKLGFNPRGLENLYVFDIAGARRGGLIKETYSKKIDWLFTILHALDDYKQKTGCKLLVLDSLSALYTLANLEKPRSELFHFFEGLRELGLTTFVISEIPADKLGYGLLGIEDFLCDGIIHLKARAGEDIGNLFIGIVKMREVNHPRRYFPLLFEKGCFEIVSE